MKTIIFGILSFILVLTGCKPTVQDDLKLVNTGDTFSLLEKYVPTPMDTISLQADSISFIGINKNKHEPFINEELPKSYTNRTFFKNLGASTYNLASVPGYIVKLDTSTGIYERKSMKPIIKNNKVPISEAISDGILYSNKINRNAGFNASAIIGGLKVEYKQMMELIIQDAIISYVPDSLVDCALIKQIVEKQIPASQRKFYYYVKNSTLTIIANRVFKETSFNANVNSTYVTAEGKIYNSNDKFSRERMVSVELISLDNLIDCQ